MILVRRDENLIPKKILAVADRAQTELENTPPDQRAAFIKKKSHIWRSFGKHLAKMSHGKCWYSECRDCHSFVSVTPSTSGLRLRLDLERVSVTPSTSGLRLRLDLER